MLNLTQFTTPGVGPGLDPFARAARDDAEAARIARARALGIAGRVGMTEMESSEATETETEEIEETEEEGTILEEGGAVEAEGATSEESWEGVEEGEEVKDDEGTVGGVSCLSSYSAQRLGAKFTAVLQSETTRGTRSSFGPSLAGTSTTASTSRTTATGSSSGGALRARVGAGRLEEEVESVGGLAEGKGKERAD